MRLSQLPGWRVCFLGAAVGAVHFACFYWWAAGDYYFTGDSLFYFSRRLTSFDDFWLRLVSVDDLYQYRPLPYLFFSFVLYPLFGAAPAPYHLSAYLLASMNALLACACIYFWLRHDKAQTAVAAVFVLLNPVNFFPSYGPAYTDVLLSVFFYYLALLAILRNSRPAVWLAPLFALLALLSREHSVLIPLEAMLILLVTGIPLREAFSRTRSIWPIVMGYVIFQFVIRQGAIFAPPGVNANLQFGFSLGRLAELARGIKPAIFYPENYHLSVLSFEIGRLGRWAFLLPWLGLLCWALLRRNKTALSGLLWIPFSILPVAFIQAPIGARHFYLAIPGLAVAFALAVGRTRMLGILTAVLALVTLTSTAIYKEESWIAMGTKSTQAYFEEIVRTANRTGRSDFYVLDSGDPHFYWHIGGGVPLKEFLRRDYAFSFESARQPLNVDGLLANKVNVVIPTPSGFREAIKTREFPLLKRGSVCAPANRIVGSQGQCAVFFRGLRVEDGGSTQVSPLLEVGEQFVALSRTTVFIENTDGVEINGSAVLSEESTDGVSLQLFKETSGSFHPLWQKDIGPGQRILIDERIEPSEASLLVFRIAPGPRRDETGDRLIWETLRESNP